MTEKTIQLEPKMIGDLLEIIHNAIIVINSDNQIIFANSRTVDMFRTSVNELQNNTIFEIFMPEDKEIMVANILHLTKNNHEFEGEAMLKRLDGTSFLGLLSGSSFQWGDNQEGMTFSIHDLTDMKAFEHSLRSSERITFLGRLVDDISHQIRNPVSVIGGFARRLKKENDSSKKITAIMNEVSHLERLLDSLNNFINLRCPVPERVSMDEFIELAENSLRNTIEKRGCKLICEHEEDFAREDLLIDKKLMMEALEAVATNGCESYNGFAGEKNILFRIHHSSDPSLPYVMRIIDNGNGISLEDSPNIFAHFYTTKTKQIGMGLTLAQRIVEEQRGVLTVDSDADNKGCTVSFYLARERRRPIRTTRLT